MNSRTSRARCSLILGVDFMCLLEVSWRLSFIILTEDGSIETAHIYTYYVIMRRLNTGSVLWRTIYIVLREVETRIFILD